MQLGTRKLLDGSFTTLTILSIVFMALAVGVIVLPIIYRGMEAFLFYGTLEHREVMYDMFGRGDEKEILADMEKANKERNKVYTLLEEADKRYAEAATKWDEREQEVLDSGVGIGDFYDERAKSPIFKEIEAFKALKEKIAELIGPKPNVDDPWNKENAQMARMRFGTNRWDQAIQMYHDIAVRKYNGPVPVIETGDAKADAAAKEAVEDKTATYYAMTRDQFSAADSSEPGYYVKELLTLYFEVKWDYPEDSFSKEEQIRNAQYAFSNMSQSPRPASLVAMMQPKFTFYWQFLFDTSYDNHFYGGVGKELLGTICLTIGAMIFSIPFGVIAAIYLVEYASDNWFVSLIRTCISTLAGVPSIAFGLFGMAFFIYTPGVKYIFTGGSGNRSLFAGCCTLAILVLPTIIRASEEAIRAVPHSYKEAAMGLGASRWRTVVTVILPAALPGILTGIVISMGRAAGETAPIVFTAAVAAGAGLDFSNFAELMTNVVWKDTPALPWNIYSLVSEHEKANMIRHVQYGMVLTLVGAVLLLNTVAIYMRARIAAKLRG